MSQFPQNGNTGDALTFGAFDLSGHFTEQEIENGKRDFCDLSSGRWVWSIGLFASGKILAACDNRFYQCDGVRCLWLR